MTAVSGNDQLLHCFYSNIFYSHFLFSLLVASSKAPEYEVFFFSGWQLYPRMELGKFGTLMVSRYDWFVVVCDYL